MRNYTSHLAFSWAFAACLVAACGGGDKETTSSTGTTDGTGGGVGGSSSSNGGAGGAGGGSASDVSGTAIDTYATSNETVTVPVSPTRWTSIEAIVEADGKWTSYPGTIEADGTVKIPGVPEGPYWLTLTSPPPADAPGVPGSKAFYATSSRALDLGSLYSFRMDVEDITQPTLVAVSATLTEPWQVYTDDGQGNVIQELDDYLQIVSFAADVLTNTYAGPSGIQDGAPLNGDMAISGWQLDASKDFVSTIGGKPHLIRSDKKDDVMVVHNVASKVEAQNPDPTDGWSSYVYTAAREAFQPASAAMTNGGTTKLDGSFVAAPKKTFSLDYKGSLWNEALKDAAAADFFSAFLTVSLLQEPGTPNPAYGGFASLLDFTIFAPSTWVDPTCNSEMCDPVVCAGVCNDAQKIVLLGDHAHDYEYGNPFTIGQEIVGVTLAFRSDVTSLLPGDATPERLSGSITVDGSAAQLSGKPLAPVVGLPRDVTVNGMATPVDKVTTGVGATPTIAFAPPNVGTPEYYSVRIIELDDVKDASNNVIRRTVPVATFSFTGTSLKIPDGLLKAGKHYYLQVSALVTGLDMASPFRVKLGFARGQTYTGIITP